MYSVLRVVDNVSNFYCAKYNDLLIQYNTMHSRLQYYVGYLIATIFCDFYHQRYAITATQWLVFYVGQCDSKNEKV